MFELSINSVCNLHISQINNKIIVMKTNGFQEHILYLEKKKRFHIKYSHAFGPDYIFVYVDDIRNSCGYFKLFSHSYRNRNHFFSTGKFDVA